MAGGTIEDEVDISAGGILADEVNISAGGTLADEVDVLAKCCCYDISPSFSRFTI